MSQTKWTARFSNTVFAQLLEAAEAVHKAARSDFSVMVRPTSSGIRWSHGAWCLYHEAIITVEPAYVDDFEIIGLMKRDGTMRALPGAQLADLPVAPIAVRLDGEIYGLTLEDLMRTTGRPAKVTRQVRYAEAVLKFMAKENDLSQSEYDEALFSDGPESTVFLIACIVRYTRDLYAAMQANDNGYEPPEANELAHGFLNEPWDDLVDVHPKGEDYQVAGAFMAHLFEMDEKKGWTPRLSDFQSLKQLDDLAGYAVSFYTRDLEPIR